jgi:hypothetical protein
VATTATDTASAQHGGYGLDGPGGRDGPFEEISEWFETLSRARAQDRRGFVSDAPQDLRTNRNDLQNLRNGASARGVRGGGMGRLKGGMRRH